MELTKDLLIERRRALEADSLAISGAIQQVDWCLDQLETSDVEDATDENISEIEEVPYGDCGAGAV